MFPFSQRLGSKSTRGYTKLSPFSSTRSLPTSTLPYFSLLYDLITGDRVNTLYNSEKNIRHRAKRHENFDIGIPKSAFVAQIKDDKQLLKVLFGVAWLDGVLEPGEKLYLQQVANQKGLAEDPEIKPLLAGEPVQSQEAYAWLQAYLGTNPSDEDYDELFEPPHV